jgi:hypothetical protein
MPDAKGLALQPFDHLANHNRQLAADQERQEIYASRIRPQLLLLDKVLKLLHAYNEDSSELYGALYEFGMSEKDLRDVERIGRLPFDRIRDVADSAEIPWEHRLAFSLLIEFRRNVISHVASKNFTDLLISNAGIIELTKGWLRWIRDELASGHGEPPEGTTDVIHLIRSAFDGFVGSSAEVQPEMSVAPIQGEQPTPKVPVPVLLNGWEEMSAALNEGRDRAEYCFDERRARIRIQKLNEETNGPIKFTGVRGAQPKVWKHELLDWMSDPFGQDDNRELDLEVNGVSPAEMVGQGRPYGRTETVFREISGHEKARRTLRRK